MRSPAPHRLTLPLFALLACGIGCGSPRAAHAEAGGDPAEAAEARHDLGALESKLSKPISSNFAGVPISRILDYLRTTTGVNFLLDRGFDIDAPVGRDACTRAVFRGRPRKRPDVGQAPDQAWRQAHIRTRGRTVRRRLVGRH